MLRCERCKTPVGSVDAVSGLCRLCESSARPIREADLGAQRVLLNIDALPSGRRVELAEALIKGMSPTERLRVLSDLCR
jgi:hypothetical protein